MIGTVQLGRSNDLMKPTPKTPVRPHDPLVVVAFCLAIFIMVIPVEVDILTPALQMRRFAAVCTVAILSFALVFVPFLVAVLRRRHQSPLPRGRGLLIATGVILSLNAIWIISVMAYRLFR